MLPEKRDWAKFGTDTGWERKKVFEIAHEKSSGCGILVKKRAGMRDQDPPFQTLALASILEAGPGGEDPPNFLRPN